jgi:PPOX class probable F420-dependent enzyme
MSGSVSKKMAALMNRGMDKMRHRGAFDVGTPTGQDFAGFDKTRQIVLVTFKRSGEAMPRPINHGVADGKVYVRTDATTGKIKRIRNNPRVLVAPSGLRGKPKGSAVAGLARILPESEHAHANKVIAANWSMPMTMLERTLDKSTQSFGVQMAYLEITPDSRSAR